MVGEKKHAKLSPSASSRWLKCTRSAGIEAQYEDRSSEAADEGSLAHALAECLLGMEFGFTTPAKGKAELNRLKKEKHYSKTMQEYVDDYVNYVIEAYNAIRKDTPDAVISIEEQIDLQAFVPEGFGTGDVVIVGAGIAHLIDLKYGKGVEVAAENNSQLKTYGAGILEEYSFTYSIKTVSLTIYQPRMGNISTWTIDAEALRHWAETVLAPQAKKAFNNEGEFVAGEHCKFCKFAPECKALAEYNLTLNRFDFADPERLTASDISEILAASSNFKSWLKMIEDFAFKTIAEGGIIPDYKIVEGRSTRQLPEGNVEKIKKVLRSLGLKKEDIIEEKLITITKMESLVGKKLFNEKAGSLLVKPQGSPTLVPASDKRPDFVFSSANDFTETEGIE